MNQSTGFDIAGVMEAVRSSGLLVSLCTITTPPGVFDDGGAPDPTAPYVVLAGHVDIPCINAPIKTSDSVAPSEQKSMQEIMAVEQRHVLLDDYYPLIIVDYRATIGGVVYDIVEVESDSQSQMTRMALQLATI